MSAELLADAGAEAASPEDFFRSPSFLGAEGTTHTLAVDVGAGRVALPQIVREVPGTDALDAVSPYGYPGGAGEGPPLELEDGALEGAGIVAAFIRDRAVGPVLAGGTERGTILLHDPERGRHLRDTFAWEARRNERDGFGVELIPGPDVDGPTLTAFNEAYEETMRGAGAAERYFFGEDYLRACLDFERSWLAVARAPGGNLGAASIAAVSDGVLHYFLAGTANAHRSASPGKNSLIALLDLADELGLPLNLGGGIKAGDGLEQFKRGFANASEPFITHELICDPDAYERLSAGRDAGDFFPAYRAP